MVLEANKRDEVDVLADSAVRASAVAAAMTEVAKLNPNTTNLDLGALGPRKKRYIRVTAHNTDVSYAVLDDVLQLLGPILSALGINL